MERGKEGEEEKRSQGVGEQEEREKRKENRIPNLLCEPTGRPWRHMANISIEQSGSLSKHRIQERDEKKVKEMWKPIYRLNQT